MTKILLDSDVVINILKKHSQTIEKLAKFDECDFYISPIVIAEIYAGIKPSEKEQVEKLFSYFKTVNIDNEVAIIAGKYANKFKKAFNGISLEDYMIAATAKYYNLPLWTYNKKHYPMKDILFV